MEDEQEEAPVDESTLPPVPIWPIWVGMVCAAAGLIVFALHPNNWTFWLGLPLSEAPLWFAYWWRSDRAEKLGYTRPNYNHVPEPGVSWGPP
ncbi:MAG: hypothetical protein ACT4QF_11045 [Sporichthyaceae bacterium]